MDAQFELQQTTDVTYLLTKTEPDGASYSIPLAEEDVMTLARKWQEFVQRILASQLPSAANLPGLEIAAVSPVVQSKVGLDIHRTMIGLSLIDAQDTSMNYSLTSEAARDIGTRLVDLADMLDRDSPTKQ